VAGDRKVLIKVGSSAMTTSNEGSLMTMMTAAHSPLLMSETFCPPKKKNCSLYIKLRKISHLTAYIKLRKICWILETGFSNSAGLRQENKNLVSKTRCCGFLGSSGDDVIVISSFYMYYVRFVNLWLKERIRGVYLLAKFAQKKEERLVPCSEAVAFVFPVEL